MGLLLASRKSDLARLQSYQVGQALKEKFPQQEVNYHFRQSLGDINQEDPLWKMPEKGVFTEDFREGLLQGQWDMVVHSWKDLPVDQEPGTEIVATLPRADVRDLFLFKKDHKESVLKSKKLRVFSSSPRRIYNLTPFFKTYFPGSLDEVEFQSVRGNILTRLTKMMESSEVDGLIVAKAAIDRLLTVQGEEFQEGKEALQEYLKSCLWQVLPLSLNPTAAAQGALAVEVASHREDLKEMLGAIHCESTWKAVCEERRILKSYGGGCHQKIGVTQLVRDYGVLTFLKGETDAGQILNHQSLKETSSYQIEREKAYPQTREELQWFDRKPLPYTKPEGKSHYVARSNALPQDVRIEDDELLWTSGLKTWRLLAQRGLWVNGSSEGLGEHEDFRLEVLGGSTSWVKWTHSSSQMGENNISTYELLPSNKPRDLSGKTSFFWMSGSSFKEALRQYPEINQAQHFCGPGNTFKIISQMLKDLNQDQKPQVVLSFEHWLEIINKES